MCQVQYADQLSDGHMCVNKYIHSRVVNMCAGGCGSQSVIVSAVACMCEVNRCNSPTLAKSRHMAEVCDPRMTGMAATDQTESDDRH